MKSILITGATGALGSALAGRLLQDPTQQLKLLIRARSAQHLNDRMQLLYRFWKIDPSGPEAQRVEALPGDVSEPRLGQDPGVYERMCGEVTHVVHAAGNVKLNQSLEAARRSAVDSLQQVLEFVERGRRAGPLVKLDVLSTVGVAGRMSGLVPEAPLLQTRAFHNTYEASKAEAEALLWQKMQDGLPATIHRPSMVVGDSRDGRIAHFQVFYNLSEFLAGIRTHGIVPDTGPVKLDLIPVDYVAGAIEIAMQRHDSIGRIFHLCSGPAASWTLKEITRNIRELQRARGRHVPKLRPLTPATFRRILWGLNLIAPAKARRFLAAVPFFLDYLAEQQEFDNQHTRAYFELAGLPLPQVEDYLPLIMQAYWERHMEPHRDASPVPLG